ncbi:hypothetical protein [Hymenobacter chitinivorans]|uniref:Outer membrane lipoprotein-sorting protein n=1 Tax=Hymenobacter chitinivorans DSM 11115 TaxID=1121954 RepID=A0A2M9B4C7_9BACT|nr:hypothetical protein [Hymenobacter chitinivorans]PJJ52795.1 hypothetical protein CLV45_3452 [Hymenobacter chitinivorans DSM 11115]
MRKALWAAACLLLTTACGQEPEATRAGQPARKPLYFDVKGFLDNQAALLTQRQPAVEKRVTLRDGQVETTRVEKVDWSKELQIFYQADINKPALRGAYEAVAAPAGDTVTTAKLYRRKAGIENIVDQLRIEETDTQGGSIEATLTQDNPLFFSRKVLALNYQNGLLKSYRVRGVQKLVMFDTLRYSATVTVLP